MPGSSDEKTYLVEHYRPGLTATELGDEATGVRDRVDTPGAPGSSSRFLCSVVVPADEAFLVVFGAGSEWLVREAYVRAGISFDRICVAITELAPSARPQRDT